MEDCSRCRSRFPLLESYERKIQRVSLEKKGVKKRGLQVGNMYVLVIQTRPVGFVPAPFSAYFDGTTMSVLRQKALILLKIVGCQSLQTPRSSATATLTMAAARRVRNFIMILLEYNSLTCEILSIMEKENVDMCGTLRENL